MTQRHARTPPSPTPPRGAAPSHTRALGLALALAGALATGACDRPSPPSPSGATSAPATAQTSAAQAAGAPLIEWVAAPDGDVASIARQEAERARRDGRRLLVYVGAAWCEPCQRFHHAAEAGQIQRGLPPLRMLEFDLDRDGERLSAAGYASKMIPLFAVPGPDGRGDGARIEGSIKGDGAVANIVPRLSALLARAGGS